MVVCGGALVASGLNETTFGKCGFETRCLTTRLETSRGEPISRTMSSNRIMLIRHDCVPCSNQSRFVGNALTRWGGVCPA